MVELNPNHETTRGFREQWHKILAAYMLKSGVTVIELSMEDIKRLDKPGGANVTIREHLGVVYVEIVSDKRAAQLAKREGGLPA